jgi:iron complex outermembrane receptor protein
VGVNDFNPNAVSPIGIYFDEVYENFALAQAFPLFDLERVEVLRGPQGTLWGKNTTGGAISFISRKPSFDTDGYVQATAGNYGELGVQGAGGGAVIADRVAARGSFFYESRNGFVKNIYNNATQGDIRDAAARLQVLLIPVDSLEITLNVHVRHNDGQANPNYLIPATGPGPIPGMNGFKEGSRFYTDENSGPDLDIDDQKGWLGNAKWEAGPVTLTSISAYENASRTTSGDGDSGPLMESVSRGFAQAKQFTQELRAAPTSPGAFGWVVGGHYFWESVSSDAASATLPAVPQLPSYGTFYTDTAFQQHTKSFAGFGNATYDFNRLFRLSAGARWTTETKEILLGAVNSGARGNASWNNVGSWWQRQSLNTPPGVAATQNTSRTWNAPTFDVSPSVHITPDATAYFHYGHGFRGGTYNGSVSTQANVSVVSPEYVDAYEIGAKTKWFADRLSVSVAAFHYAYENVQVLVNAATKSTTVTATVLQNAGSGTVNGAELETDILPVRAFRVHGALGLLDTRYGGFTTVNNNMVVNASGNQFTRSPHLTALIDAEYRIPFSKSVSIALGSDWEYMGHQFFNAVDQQNPNLQQNGYVLGNARLSLFSSGDRFELQGWVHNLTDLQYKIIGTQGGVGYNSVVWGPPRMYGATLIAKF